MTGKGRTVLVVGFPGSLAERIAANLVLRPDTRIVILVEAAHAEEAQRLAAGVDGRVRILIGSLTRIDFGLTGPDYLSLSNEVAAIVALDLPAPRHGEPPTRARAQTREVIELALAAPRLEHAIVLSHLDVCGSIDGVFAEHDLDAGQEFSSEDAEDRFRAERVLRRFAGRLPLTIVRTGWLCGRGTGLAPVAHLLLASQPELAASLKDMHAPLLATDVAAAAEIVSTLAARPGPAGGETLHLIEPGMGRPLDLAARVSELALSHVPSGFDLVAGARRALKRGGQDAWSPREFFRAHPRDVRVSTAHTERLLAERGLSMPAFDDTVLTSLVLEAVEEIVGFR
ncbi:MAG: hypothetical protein PHU25_00360 [Deltaproteobacteria bacterium]|nr:hypothetical protein [Deltaproteobacteria bacterium]